jgi:peptide/nickel transport system substrate-binding protein
MEPTPSEPAASTSGPSTIGPSPTPSKRKWIVLALVALLVIAAAAGAYLLFFSGGSASLKVSTQTVFATAGESVPFAAELTLPPRTTVSGPILWTFGDGTTTASSGTTVSHIYGTAGTFFVGSETNLSNGGKISNFDALFPMYVGPPKNLTDRDSLGVIAVNKTASSSGAPTISAGGHVVALGTVQQAPTYFFSTNSTPGPGAVQWVNYTWGAISLTFDYGDGSAPLANASDQPLKIDHTYATAGIRSLRLSVTTQNMSTTTDCDLFGCTENPIVPVSPAQTRTTVVAQTIAVGSYKLVTYSGSITNPGLIVVQEAVTGGYTTLDPGVDYESVGFETIANTYQTLLWYDGAKTDTFVPVLSDRIPSVAAGTISADHRTYTFHMRPGAKFADGTAVTAWDVKYSFTRTLLFVFGTPGTSGWIQGQYMLPSFDPADLTFDNVNNAVTVNNVTQEVTFHLVTPVPELLWFQIIADPLGSSVVSSKWLEDHGPKLLWNPAGFADYQKYGDLVNYVPYWRDHTMGSGPFVVDYVVPGESVALKANPNFQPVPGIPAPKVQRVFLQYVESASTRELSLESGQADITSYNPSNRFDVMKRMQTNGLVNIEFLATLNMFWWNFNFEIASSTDNNVPSDFFVDLPMRKAFSHAYDYNGYIDNIVGNKQFNATFAETFNGIIPRGMIGYEDLSSYNTFDMVQARQFYNQTSFVATHGGWTGASFHLTLVVPTADPVNFAGARAWGDNLQRLGPAGNIVIDVRAMSFADIIAEMNPHANRMSLWYLGWLPDYPYPTDYTFPMLQPGNALSEYGGTYPAANGFNISYLASKGETVQAQAAQTVSDWINTSLSETDINEVVRLSRMAQREAMLNLTIYVPSQQQYSFFVSRTWIQGISLEKNPMLGGTDLLYNLLTKTGTVGSASPQSSSPPSVLAAVGEFAPWVALAGLIATTKRKDAYEERPSTTSRVRRRD